MNRFFLSATLASFASVACAATPTLKDSETVLTAVPGKVTVSYELEQAPAVVTFDILTNGVSIGAAALSNAAGDVNKVVQPGKRTITWKPHKAFAGDPAVLPNACAVVTSWPTNRPPDYMVVDLTSGDCTYYVSKEALPGGLVGAGGDVVHDPYRTTKLVLKKIRADGIVWMMGDHVRAADYDMYTEYPRMVRLSSDFYIGIYEFTQGQYKTLMDGKLPKNEAFADRDYSDALPVNMLAAEDIRGNLDWPTNKAVGASSPMGVLSLRTGIAFDMPTEAQWEYVCRAGGNLSYGRLPTATGIGDYAWYNANSTNAQTNAAEPHPVGTKKPNAWGIYDMQGNAEEWCLLWQCNAVYKSSVFDATRVVVDPEVTFENSQKASDGTGYRCTRGGSYVGASTTLRCAQHGGSRAGSKNIGFRVACYPQVR